MEFDIRKTNMVKCMAIILMLIHHLFSGAPELCIKYGTESRIFAWNDIMAFSEACKICVGMFVFLTAFGITRAYRVECVETGIASGNALGKFCIKRYVKLEMNFLFVYMLTIMTYFLRAGGVRQIYGIFGIKRGILYAVIDALGFAIRFSTPTLNPTWWYMSTAVLLVFLIPILVQLYKKYGICTIVCCAFFFSGRSYDGVSEYVLCMCVGIFCAETRVLEKMYRKRYIKQNIFNSCVKMLVYLSLIVFLIYVRIKVDLHFFVDAAIPVLCSGFCMELSSLFPVSEKVMGFIGEYSMNMFLIHTLIFSYYFPQYVYRPKNWLAVLFVLLVTSLILSIVIEKLKELLGYKIITEKVIRCVN